MSGFGQPCGVCGEPATTADGVVGEYLCDKPECLDVAWDRAEWPAPLSPVRGHD